MENLVGDIPFFGSLIRWVVHLGYELLVFLERLTGKVDFFEEVLTEAVEGFNVVVGLEW